MQTVQTSAIKRSKPHKSKQKLDYVQVMQKQQKFDNRYSINDKPKHYDALKDPYTSYYFSNRSVKQHLKEFKKALKFEPNLTEKSKLNQLINIRLKEKHQDVINPKTSIYQRQLNSKDKMYLHQSSAKSINIMSQKSRRVYGSLKEGQPKDNNQAKNVHLPKLKQEEASLTNKPQIQAQADVTLGQKQKQKQKQEKVNKSTSKSNKQKMLSDRLAQELHLKKHKKWLQFLQQKRKLLTKMQQQPNK